MESLGFFPDGEWSSFNAIFNSDELEMPRFLRHFSSPGNDDACVSSPPLMGIDPPANPAPKSCFYSLDALDTDFHLTKKDYSCSYMSSLTPQPNYLSLFIDMNSVGEGKGGSFFPSLAHVLEEDRHQALRIHGDMGSDGCEILDHNHPTSIANNYGKEEGLKRKFNGGVMNTHLSDNPMKKSRDTQHTQKSRKTVETTKTRLKIKKNSSKTSVETDGDGGSEGQSSSSCATSGSKRCEALYSNGKTRSERGSATDPQSLYARKRRERINERLRILQKLIPNGTKVDISTMLEEAVHYVKFLQLQIKLLSSDDHWMYAPIAYNGMDIDLQQKLSPIILH